MSTTLLCARSGTLTATLIYTGSLSFEIVTTGGFHMALSDVQLEQRHGEYICEICEQTRLILDLGQCVFRYMRAAPPTVDDWIQRQVRFYNGAIPFSFGVDYHNASDSRQWKRFLFHRAMLGLRGRNERLRHFQGTILENAIDLKVMCLATMFKLAEQQRTSCLDVAL
jgi:hypothetical protein